MHPVLDCQRQLEPGPVARSLSGSLGRPAHRAGAGVFAPVDRVTKTGKRLAGGEARIHHRAQPIGRADLLEQPVYCQRVAAVERAGQRREGGGDAAVHVRFGRRGDPRREGGRVQLIVGSEAQPNLKGVGERSSGLLSVNQI